MSEELTAVCASIDADVSRPGFLKRVQAFTKLRKELTNFGFSVFIQATGTRQADLYPPGFPVTSTFHNYAPDLLRSRFCAYDRVSMFSHIKPCVMFLQSMSSFWFARTKKSQ